MLSGYDTVVERRYPTICGIGFRGWVQRPGLIARIRGWIYGYTTN